MDTPDLSVVVPVYNEGQGITDVVASWTAVLNRLGIDYEFLLYDDGSTDETGARLDAIAAGDSRVRVAHQTNRGHGCTVLRGYREARGIWAFQTDSDDEIPAEAFESVWLVREGHDAVFGIRTGRSSALGRRLLTFAAARTVRLLFGRGPWDVNVPFRLIRRDALARLIPHIADDTFAPNVILSGLVARGGLSFVEVPVPAVERRLGQTTISGFKTLRLGVRAARETIRAAVLQRTRRDRG